MFEALNTTTKRRLNDIAEKLNTTKVLISVAKQQQKYKTIFFTKRIFFFFYKTSKYVLKTTKKLQNTFFFTEHTQKTKNVTKQRNDLTNQLKAVTKNETTFRGNATPGGGLTSTVWML